VTILRASKADIPQLLELGIVDVGFIEQSIALPGALRLINLGFERQNAKRLISPRVEEKR
jgi:hypothetical protein